MSEIRDLQALAQRIRDAEDQQTLFDIAETLERLASPKPDRFDCPECGPCVGVDEDGCCTTCGADAVVVLAGIPEQNLAERPPAKVDLVKARHAIDKFRDAAREGRTIDFRERDGYVAVLHDALDELEGFEYPSKKWLREQAAVHEPKPDPTPDAAEPDDDSCSGCGHSESQHRPDAPKGWSGECRAWHCGCPGWNVTKPTSAISEER